MMTAQKIVKNLNPDPVSLKAKITTIILLAVVVCLVLASATGQNLTSNQPTQTFLFRDIETKVELIPDTKTIILSLTNLAEETRYVMVPPDLMPYRIQVTTARGQQLTMTPKGKKDLTEPGIGSVRGIWLEKGVPWSHQINLEALFEFPKNEEVRCVISRHVLFSHPNVKPPNSAWIAFPPIKILPRSSEVEAMLPTSPDTIRKSSSAPESSRVEKFLATKAPEAMAVTRSPEAVSISSLVWGVVFIAAIGLLWLILKTNPRIQNKK